MKLSNLILAGYRLTTGRHYLILPFTIDRRLQDASLPVYWRFMTRQLRSIGLAFEVGATHQTR